MSINAKKLLLVAVALVALLPILAAACTSGVPQEELDAVKAQLTAKEQEAAQLRTQLAAIGPSTVVQAGQLQPAPAGAQPSGWDTAESIRGGLHLVATYDSSGPDAWDVKAHPTVYMTSEGMGYGHRPSSTNKLPGVQVIDAYTKEVVTSALFDLGGEQIFTPHGLGVSPDGKWVYIGTRQRLDGKEQALSLVINARTLKLDKTLKVELPGSLGVNAVWYQSLLHHVMSFKDWQGRDRVVLEYGFGSNGGPHFILDPKDDNRVVKAITYDDTRYQMGHPFLTVDPTGKFLYVSVKAVAWQDVAHEIGGIWKYNMETGAGTVIAGTGDHPIGVTHTSDGKFTYVVDGHGSRVYKIDNESNEIVGDTSAGVAGPYGIALNWDETEIWTVGKGEGSHNTGGVLGLIDAKTFQTSRAFNQPFDIGGSIIDHATLHPDPAVNELWVSSAGTWETIVFDLSTKEVKARIPSPHGGDTHSGAFVRYNSDWAGEVLADHGGPHKAMHEIMKDKAAQAAATK